MITDILALEEDAALDAEVIVVGSGIAGAEIAIFLAQHGVQVLMLESGREAFEPAVQALNEVRFSAKPHRRIDPDADYHPYLPPELRGVSRVRQLGGTSNVWTGKWKYLQESDFPGRPWVADSVWPITFADLVEHYRGAARDYGFGDLEAEARTCGDPGSPLPHSRRWAELRAFIGNGSRPARASASATRCGHRSSCGSCWGRPSPQPTDATAAGSSGCPAARWRASG